MDTPENLTPFERAQAFSKEAVTNLAKLVNLDFDAMMAAGDLWMASQIHSYENTESYKHVPTGFYDEFWEHYAVLRGKRTMDAEELFTCSC